MWGSSIRISLPPTIRCPEIPHSPLRSMSVGVPPAAGERDGESTPLATWKPRIYYNDSERGPIPLWQLLIEQREKLGVTWQEFGELLDVPRLGAYALRTSQGHPNEPSDEVLRNIVGGLGLPFEDFTVGKQRHHGSRQPEQGSEEYQGILRRLGDAVRTMTARNLQRGRRSQLLSFPLIRHVAGEMFAKQYALTFPDRQALHREIASLGYDDIGLQHQVQRRGVTRSRSVLEEHLITEGLREYLREHSGRMENFQAAIRHVRASLNRVRFELHTTLQHQRDACMLNEPLAGAELPPRSWRSLEYQVAEVWGKVKHLLLEYGSPEPNAPVNVVSPGSPAPTSEGRRNVGRGEREPSLPEPSREELRWLSGQIFQTPDGVLLGVYDADDNLLEINGTLYHTVTPKARHAVESWLDRGIVTIGAVNRLKYEREGRGRIVGI